MCTAMERDFLKTLSGGCSTPISALAEVIDNTILFKGNILSIDGKQKAEVEKAIDADKASHLGQEAAEELLNRGGRKIAEEIRNAAK